MKKYLSLLLAVALLATLCIPASAAQTGTFVDEIPADSANFKPEVIEFSSVGEDPANSHKIAVENNPDIGETLLLKTAAPRDAKHTEYIVYKMNDNIGGFKLDVMCCAGLGNPKEDITVFISKDGSAWNEISTQATKYTYDEDIYINFDKAYWHKSTITNKKTIKAGYKYIKIQFNPCTESNDVPWNIAVDRVTVYLGTDIPATTISAEDKFETYEQINATKTTASTQGGNTPVPPAGGDNTTSASKDSGNNNTTAGKNDKTTAGKNDPTKATVKTTTSINDKGEVITEAPVETTTSIDENGQVITEAPVETNPTDANGDDVEQDAAVDGGDEDKPSALPYIIIAIVVVLAGAGVGVYFFLKKKKA